MVDPTPLPPSHFQRLVTSDSVVVFMKGSPSQPRCGFSARVCELVQGHLGEAFAHVDVLSDPRVREGVKRFADWPTFPQLWVDGQLLGGADIVEQLHEDGTLQSLLAPLAPPAPAPPSVSLTPSAYDRIMEVLDVKTDARLRLRIRPSFQYAFEPVDDPDPTDVLVTHRDLLLVLDRASAPRAEGMTIDFEPGEGGGMVIDNPNAPTQVKPLSVLDYARLLDAGQARSHRLIDVRTSQERAIAHLPDATALDEAALPDLEALPRDTPLVFMCHHGVRSQRAAERFLELGFQEVYNLEGGIDAWSLHVDPGVPRY